MLGKKVQHERRQAVMKRLDYPVRPGSTLIQIEKSDRKVMGTYPNFHLMEEEVNTNPVQDYFRQVFDWVIKSNSWLGIGPMWQMVGVLLFGFTLLQVLPESAANGWLFSKKALKITFTLDAIWVYLVFVAPFVPASVTIALLVVAALVVAAVLSYKKWH